MCSLCLVAEREGREIVNSPSPIIDDELDSSPSLNPDLWYSLLLLIASYMLDMKHLPLTIRRHTNIIALTSNNSTTE